MVYIKSLVAGIAAVLIAIISAIFGAVLHMYIASRSMKDGAIGWDPISLLKRPLAWTVTALIFVSGFLWEFRRAGK